MREGDASGTFGPISSRTMSFSLKNIICEGQAMDSRQQKGSAYELVGSTTAAIHSTYLHARLQIRRRSLGRETERML